MPSKSTQMTALETSVAPVVLSIQTASNANEVTFAPNAVLPLELTSIMIQTPVNPVCIHAKRATKNTSVNSVLDLGWPLKIKPKDNASTVDRN